MKINKMIIMNLLKPTPPSELGGAIKVGVLGRE